MATSNRPDAPHRTFALRAATALVAGAVCAAVAGTAPAAADDQQFTAPVGQLPTQLTEALGLGPNPLAGFGFGAPTPALPPRVDLGPPPPAPDLVQLVTSALGIAPVPAPAAVVPPPAPVQATPLVAPVAPAVDAPATAEQIRIGRVELGRPGIITPEQAAEINGGAAGFENALSDVLDSTGMDPRRSDVIAEYVIGDAAMGAVIGGVAIAPVASLAAVAGGMVGFLFGIPFLPTGLVIGPAVGAAMGYAFGTGPGVVTGAVIGAAVGAMEGSQVPLDPAPPAA
ncbi:hypothetical protein [Nocardia shimofusensis]|uniref:hypothetical protein n=1 Tax=Nocardia shimofusensis TaxID=228596 RepID=UPI00082F6890|nr:hypothetical protein [Nocardia shimofusensis]